MRLNINLATRPYEDLGKFLARWGTLTALLAAVTAGLCFMAYSNWYKSSDVNRQIADLNQKLEQLDKEREAAIDTLNKPENKGVADQSRFLNDAIQRKSLSWTRIFMDLEKIMPTQLHVISITPELGRGNQILIRLSVAGQSREKAIELVRKMEDSATFKNAELHSESMVTSSNTGDRVQFDITSNYVPAPETAEAASAAEKSAGTPVAKNGGTR